MCDLWPQFFLVCVYVCVWMGGGVSGVCVCVHACVCAFTCGTCVPYFSLIRLFSCSSVRGHQTADCIQSLNIFKSHLKTHLFSLAFYWCLLYFLFLSVSALPVSFSVPWDKGFHQRQTVCDVAHCCGLFKFSKRNTPFKHTRRRSTQYSVHIINIFLAPDESSFDRLHAGKVKPSVASSGRWHSGEGSKSHILIQMDGKRKWYRVGWYRDR